MSTEDLTPTFRLVTAVEEIVIPPLVSDTTNQPIGGFMATPSALTQGSVTLNGVREQVLVGAATAPLTGRGIFIGNPGDNTYDFRAGDPTGNYIHYDESAGTLTVVGSITVTAGGTVGGFTVGADYIRDTANSFGLASTVTGGTDVRFWAGESFANRATAPARVYEDGSAVFKSVQVGGNIYQYTMNDQGIYTFGDGSDSAVDFDGTNTFSFASKSGANYTLTRDVFAVTVTVRNSVFLYTNGYRIFCLNSLSLVSGGQILNDGNAASGSTGGAAQTDGYLKGGKAGANGGGGGAGGNTSNGFDGTAGSAASSFTNSLTTQGGTAGARGGIGGGANANTGGNFGAGGSAGSATARNIKPVLLWNFMSFFDINSDGTLAKYTGAIPGSGGGGGGGGANPISSGINQAGSGGAGGGGGGSGGIIFIAARSISLAAGSNIYARGGAGGNGTNGGNAAGANPTACGGGGGGGGGAGGAGGIVFLIYNTLTNAGTITYTGGAGGSAGSGGTGINTGATGNNGVAGSTGATGELIQINMAL